MFFTVSPAVIPAIPAIFIPTFVVATFLMHILPDTVLFLVTRSVLAVVPLVLYKEDSLAAGAVFTTMPFPMSGMARRDMQVDRGTDHRCAFDDHGLGIDDLRLRKIADVESTVETRLADADRDAHFVSEYPG